MQDDSIASGEKQGLAPIEAIEARILGSLIEKEATTPDAYPLTANAVQLACNQKNNREPVMELEPGAVGHALRELERKGLVASVHGARAQRYEHRFAKFYSVTGKQQALLSVMLLRGPQTVAELLSRCERLTDLADAEDVRVTLERLMQRSPELVVKLGRAAGQREDRYMHLLCGPVSADDFSAVADSTAPRRAALEARVEALEIELADLREQVQALLNARQE
ncbi:MAG TPA: DUF480 domain-containing protein [Arenimonas sp.]|nr:DUF480 domain-containing protein [Arenimonas sp.]